MQKKYFPNSEMSHLNGLNFLHIYTYVSCDFLRPKFLPDIKVSCHVWDTNFVCINSWLSLGLGHLVHLQFPAAKNLILGFRKSHVRMNTVKKEFKKKRYIFKK